MYKRLLLPLLLLMSAGSATAQSNLSGIDTLSLQDLMNVKITVASARELTPRESPGIVSYITAEDIRATGARDLMDVLMLVPGFEFGVDVEGVVGLGVRGNWAHEGKVVLLINGMEMNETLYSTLQFGNHYNADDIERIEIIRGPGSALYGGFAAYAVINVITRKPQTGKEVNASLNASTGTRGVSRTGFSLYQGLQQQELNTSLSISYSESERSQERYTDVYGSSYGMHQNSELNNLNINGQFRYSNTKLQFIADNFHTTSRDEYLNALTEEYNIDYNNYITALSHDINIGKKWKLVPKVQYHFQQPWRSEVAEGSADGTPFHVNTNRFTGQLNATGEITKNFNVIAGFNYFKDISFDQVPESVFLRTGTSRFEYSNSAFFAQGLYTRNNWTLVGGARFNFNSMFDAAVTPRTGITYVNEKWHFKALYSKSFRAPSTQNLDAAENIYPELTDVMEIETGIAIGKHLYLTVNGFNIYTTDPIIYYFDTLTNSDGYTNFSRTGSQGAEFSLCYKKARTLLETHFTWYTASKSSTTSIYMIEGVDDEFLGMAPFKGSLIYRYKICKSWTANLTGIYHSEKYAVTRVDEITEEQTFSRLNALILFNLNIEYASKRHKGAGIAFGVRNITDQTPWYVQPYKSNHAPLPGMGRELTIKLFYRNF